MVTNKPCEGARSLNMTAEQGQMICFSISITEYNIDSWGAAKNYMVLYQLHLLGSLIFSEQFNSSTSKSGFPKCIDLSCSVAMTSAASEFHLHVEGTRHQQVANMNFTKAVRSKNIAEI